MDPKKNVTLSISEPLLRRFRVYAAARNQSMTTLMTEAIRGMLDEERHREQGRRRFLERARNAPDRGTKGVIPWKRDDLYER